MEVNVESIWGDLEKIRKEKPLIHNITNYVVMNTTANALLALGASPVMAHALEEAAEMVQLAGALVLNIGTLSPAWVQGMHRAALRARELGVPVVLDPVGAGATPYRTRTLHELLDRTGPEIIRGNASEIRALVETGATTKGVDSTAAPEEALQAAQALAQIERCTVCVSGSVDYIVAGEEIFRVHNGDPLMTRVTGLGCTASAFCGAFAAVNPRYPEAVTHAMAVMGIAGEMAAERAEGPGSLQLHFLDTLYNLTREEIGARLQVES
ncbi:MAG: hydroxyethylthiazole kinase [Firmicutes bacterium]|nr:hydroxyethylthiazole kinase [Bacillota bacterium]